MRFTAFTFAFGCAATVSALPVDSGIDNGGGLQAASGFQTGDVSSDTLNDIGETSLDTVSPTPSVPSGSFAPTDAASVTVTGGASALSGPLIPTSLAAPAFSDIASLIGSGGASALSDAASLTSLLAAAFSVPTNLASAAGAPLGSTSSPSAFIASNNASNATGASANLTGSGLKGLGGSLDPTAFVQSNGTGFNNSAFNFPARNNVTLLDNSTSGDLNLTGQPKLNITVHEFGSE
ncbi:hypothetical protein EWM64_g7853 [Hericium alpestre]|uniref:Uncharacterized protein n=1 Tax=Hericium alpestre TaxID=135208 RepID=A0A4Y9ZRN6_9AGAM|nr:hypothetical protein EWM64_g7853 [Hericium alpestre]